ncbi:MAG: glycosyltransferase family 2 protein [Aliivibrio sp.]|uniref:glycosyltransferase family 2 protein n=1 Tax=Aliivibrio sp. TaxID=1872443 RepID=UPI001A471A12|nr:glycosyltransferase family 2 protein [Aliivibrio sp.]
MMKYSIVIPCFNAEKTILNSLLSVVEQSFDMSAVEVVIVNDFSTDNSCSLINDFIKSHESTINFILINNASNYGVSKSRNIGIDSSNSDYVLFLDSDDEFSPEKLKVIDKWVCETGIDFMYHDFTVSGDSCGELAYSRPNQIHWIFPYFNVIKNHICTPCVIIKTKLAKEVRFSEDLSHMEDLELWTTLLLSKSVKAYYLNETLTSLGHQLNGGDGLSSQHYLMRKMERKMLKTLMMKYSSFFILFPVYISLSYLKDWFKKIRHSFFC